MNRTIDIEFITPLFSHGATDLPEIRPASIRGQLHAWFRIVGGDIEAERRVFGGIKQKNADSRRMPSKEEAMASKIVVRVCNVDGRVRDLPTLPHKSEKEQQAYLRKAYDAGTKCRIMIMDRLGDLSESDEMLLNRAVDAWLLMGTLGYRSTRAAGSFVWCDESFPMPLEPLAYQDACRDLLDESDVNCKVAVLDRDYSKAEVARRDVSDSLGGKNDQQGQDDLARMHDPLGKVNGGRKTSPLKYRIVRFADKFRILAFWDGRKEVTGNSDDDFYDVVDLLDRCKHDRIGSQLKAAFG